MKNEVLAICLKTHPDEEDMRAFCEGEIKCCDVKIYYKGRKYWVTVYCDVNYYTLLEPKS